MKLHKIINAFNAQVYHMTKNFSAKNESFETIMKCNVRSDFRQHIQSIIGDADFIKIGNSLLPGEDQFIEGRVTYEDLLKAILENLYPDC